MARHIILPGFALLLIFACVVEGGGGGGGGGYGGGDGHGGHGGGGWNHDWNDGWSDDWSNDDDWDNSEGHEEDRHLSSEDEDEKEWWEGNKPKDDAEDEANANEGVEEPSGGQGRISEVSPLTTESEVPPVAQIDPELNVRAIVGAVVGTTVLLVAAIVAVVLVVHYNKKVNGPTKVTPDAMPDVKQLPPAYDVISVDDTKKEGLPYIVPFSFEQAPASTLYPPSYSSINIRDDDAGQQQHTVITVQPAPMKCYGDPPKY